ncbi:uncharacterized protein LOC110108712 [Dendrobium catenatum]|uniref:uncharacterized protein LOC110108712 n=1 Tax=Dendrobium catenatum TaxID=906689 RepID=UPI0010A04575|nr:uncharacterized protein LOC110108712 [Dendrobium catenatum]
MAPKRRHRRTEMEPNRRMVSDEPIEGNQTDEFDGHRRLPISPFTIFFVVLFLLASSFAVYWGSRSTRKAPSHHLSVYERGIVKTDVCYKEILIENARVMFNRSVRHFPNPVLAYITPCLVERGLNCIQNTR